MTGTLAAALAAFQGEMPTVAKSNRAEVPTKSGGKYTYTYADLADVSEAAMPLLAKHELAFTCCPRATERGYELVGVLLHSSGESREGALPIAGNSPQEMGSSITYMRRYLLGCLTGLVTDDDDDGHLAQQAGAKRAQRKPRQSRAKDKAPESPLLNTKGDLARHMFSLFNEVGISGRDERLAYVSDVVGRSVQGSAAMTDADAEQVVASLNTMRDRLRAEADAQEAGQ